MKFRKHKSGFTLVELAIVLVIVGLLVGGVIKGQELIRQSKIQRLFKELENYRSATLTFKLKYDEIPGDMPKALIFFANCNTSCNGNGDNVVNYGRESFRYWQLLEMAGLIQGHYTGISASAASDEHAIVGQNIPVVFDSVGVSLYSWGNVTNNGWLYTGLYNNVFMIGQNEEPYYNYKGAFTPFESQQIDEKLDDGKPGLGSIKQVNYLNTTCVTSTNESTAVWKSDNDSDRVCPLYINGNF